MRILILVHGYPPTFADGAELRAERTVRALIERGHDILVMSIESVDAADGHPSHLDSWQDGARVRRLYLSAQAGRRPPVWEHDNAETAAAMAQLIDECRPDIVHLFSGYLMTGSVVRQARDMGISTIVSLTDYWWLCHRITLLRTDGTRCDGPTPVGCARCQSESFRRFRLPARVWPQTLDHFWRLSSQNNRLSTILNLPYHATRLSNSIETLNMVDALIAPSHHLANSYIHYGVDPEKLRVWRQGVDINYCVVRRPAQPIRVGYLGQVKYHKGVDLLVNAWRMLSGPVERQLVIYGSDAGEEKFGHDVRQQIAELRDVEWKQPVDRRAVWEVLADLDVVVVPSRWVENSPNIILEAQAAGVVVVGTNLGGVAELIGHEENGLLFEPDSAEDLAGQLQRLLNEPELLAELRRTQLPFQNFTTEIDRIESLYASLAEVDNLQEQVVATA
jgi:glycosyltransferase involved in cell wall biosynthesis